MMMRKTSLSSKNFNNYNPVSVCVVDVLKVVFVLVVRVLAKNLRLACG